MEIGLTELRLDRLFRIVKPSNLNMVNSIHYEETLKTMTDEQNFSSFFYKVTLLLGLNW